MNDSKAFCMMPFVHLHINTEGQVLPCCVTDKSFGDINQSSVDEIWNNKEFEKFRDNLKQDIQRPDICSYCYNQEKSGVVSLRQHTNKNYEHKKYLIDNPKPIYWDIRFSNVCNLKCRTCYHGASSNWFEDSKILRRNVGNSAIIHGVHDTDKLFKELEKYKFSLEELYFAGGEPLMMDEHYKILNHLISIGRTNVKLRYNTNLSILKYKNIDVLDLWNQFNDIKIHASVDGMGKVGELVRKGMNWNIVEQNIKNLRIKCPHIDFKIACTVSALNVYHIPDFYRYMVKSGNNLIDFHEIYLNMLSQPEYYNIQIFPYPIKLKIKELYQELYREYPLSLWLELIAYMIADDKSEYIKDFKKECETINKLRKESIIDTIPELKEVINYE